MKRLAAELRLAVSFLTVAPVGPAQSVAPELLGRSLAWFPLVGLLLGLLLAGAERALQLILPPVTVSALLVLLAIVLTGALHLDGVADSADGLYGQRERESRLRIMKDSRVGAMGVTALLALLLLKFAALQGLAPERRWAALLLMPVVGRWCMTVLAVCSPYARPEGGTGGGFVDQAGGRELLLATVTCAALTVFLYGWPGVLLLALLCLAIAVLRAYYHAKLGGVTGDLLGAGCEWSEALTLTLLATTWFNP